MPCLLMPFSPRFYADICAADMPRALRHDVIDITMLSDCPPPALPRYLLLIDGARHDAFIAVV